MYPVRQSTTPAVLPPPSRLLLPRIRVPQCYRPVHSSRVRSSSSSQLPGPGPELPSTETGLEWLGLPLAFDVIEDQLEIEGYQMYAVEKWIVERIRPITVLTVYTGDPSHKITVTALAPSTSLSDKDVAVHWEQALLHLRRDASARPKQTPSGVLMATSLAYFRSDYTIVHIPHGNFLLAKNQLYTNINLLRMGCGGRSALTLEEPSDSTKDRFISTYHIPEITLPSSLPLPLHHHPHPASSDHLPLPPSQPISASSSLTSRDIQKASPTRRPTHRRSQSHSSPKGSMSKTTGSRPSIHIVRPTPTSSVLQGSSGSFALTLLGTHTKGKTRDLPFFNATVLELVKLLQVGLALFGMYAVKEGLSCTGGGMLLVDGLLCDVTVRGIEQWIAEIGEPRAGLEPAERIADPMFVSALLSLVLSLCNKLSAFGPSHVVPKDPFLHPHAFASALSSYISNTCSLSPHISSPTSPPMMPSYAGSGHTHFPMSPLTATIITTAPFSATAFLNPGSSSFPPPIMSSPYLSNSNSINATQPQLSNTASLTRELVESIESAYAKRAASMNNENESMIVSSFTGLGPGTGNPGNTSANTTTTTGGAPASVSGSGTPTKSQTRRVKQAIKGKLEDLSSAVATATTSSNLGDRDYDGGEVVDKEMEEKVGGGALSGGETDGGNPSVGNSGGQLFRGMGNLILGGASGITGGAAHHPYHHYHHHYNAFGGSGNIWDVNVELERFVSAITEPPNNSSSRRLGVRSRKKKGSYGKGSESVDLGRGFGSGGSGGGLPLPSGFSRSSDRTNIGMGTAALVSAGIPQSVVNGDHGVIVAMLWSGRVADVVAMREWERERVRVEGLNGSGGSQFGIGSGGGGTGSVVSDGEEARSEGFGGRSTEGEDSDLHMEGRFGGVWSERVQRKLESWTGLSKRRGPHIPGLDAGSGSIGRKGGVNRFSSLGNSMSPGPRIPSVESNTSTPSKVKVNTDNKRGRAQSPTLHPPLSGDMEQDDGLLESGQVSPNSDYRHTPFTLEEHHQRRSTRLYDVSQGVSTADLGRSGSSNADHTGLKSPSRESYSGQLQSTDVLTDNNIPPQTQPPLLQPPFELGNEKEKGQSYSGLALGRRWDGNARPAFQRRITSWSDTKSAWSDEAFWMGGGKKGEKHEGKAKRPNLKKAATAVDLTRERVVDDDEEEETKEIEGEREREIESDNEGDNKRSRIDILSTRRRSYHDLDSLRSMQVLSPERMKIDVELCAQVLVMVRREEHLRNVIACLETLTSTLHTSNSLLRDDFELHKDAILEIERRAQVISEIEGQVAQTNSITQAKNTLLYESAQFLISELWHTASLSRKKIFELREKVFGAGGRRLPPGKHGAHGRFNRVQWTLDGERRLVDYLGRTEEEAEEENMINGQSGLNVHVPPSPVEEEEVIEHAGMKPMWLLRFFTSWGARWSALRVGGGQPLPQPQEQQLLKQHSDATDNVVTLPVEESPKSQPMVEAVKPEN